MTSLEILNTQTSNRFSRVYVYINACIVIITKTGGHEYEKKSASWAENKRQFIYLYFIIQKKIKIQTF